MTTSVRKSAEERREEILEAAMIEFAEKGLYGTSTDDIARRVGVSQPYLFRLYGTKKELFVAAVERCFENTLAMMRAAAGGKVGEEALDVCDHLDRPLHDDAGQLGRDDGAPGDQDRSPREPAGARVDGERLHPHVRGAAPHGCGAGRPLRAAPPVRDRLDHLHRRVRG